MACVDKKKKGKVKARAPIKTAKLVSSGSHSHKRPLRNTCQERLVLSEGDLYTLQTVTPLYILLHPIVTYWIVSKLASKKGSTYSRKETTNSPRHEQGEQKRWNKAYSAVATRCSSAESAFHFGEYTLLLLSQLQK